MAQEYFEQRSFASKKKSLTLDEIEARNRRRYESMVYSIGLLFALVVGGFGFRGVSFNPWFLNGLLLHFFLLLPSAALVAFLFGPPSWCRRIGLLLSVPLAILGVVFSLFEEYGDPTIENFAFVLQHGGLTDGVLRRFTSDGEVIGEGTLGASKVRLIQWSRGAFMSFRYRFLVTRDKGPYFYEVLYEEELGGYIDPHLLKLPDGRLRLLIKDRKGKQIFSHDFVSDSDFSSVGK